jgi:AbrB family looped-hinge helix DNA binding protein
MGTATSRITSKFQTTIPKAIREILKLSVRDTLNWEIEADRIVVKPNTHQFLTYRNRIKTGPGNIENDRELAIQQRLKKYR